MPFQNLSNDLSFNGFASFTVNKTMMLKYKVHTVVNLNHSPHRDTRRFPEILSFLQLLFVMMSLNDPDYDFYTQPLSQTPYKRTTAKRYALKTP